MAKPLKKYLPLIRNRDHPAILRNCKSFNPTRKAYGAVCLYALQQMGEPLTKEEIALFNNIRQSNETTDYAAGCRGEYGIKLSAILTTSALQSIYLLIKEGLAKKPAP